MRRVALPLLSAFAALGVAAGCGGGSASSSGSGDFTVTAGASSLNVPQAKSASLQVTLNPINGFKGSVALTASGLPTGVSAVPVTIPEGTLTGAITLVATSAAVQGASTSATITAEAVSDPTLTHAISTTVVVIGAPGDLDTSFATSGVYGYSFAGTAGLFAMAFQPGTDELLVAGNGNDGGVNGFAVSLINPGAGAPDTGFGGGTGTVLIGFGGFNAYARSMAVSPLGGVALSGYVVNGATSSLAVALLTSSGALSVQSATVPVTFGNGGAVTGINTINAPQQFSGIAFQQNGNLVVAASSDTSGALQIVVSRLLPSGSFDPSFNTTGQLVIPAAMLGGTVNQARAVALDASGNVLVCGQGGASNTAFVARIVGTTGRLDTSFGGTGIVLVPFGAGANFCNSIVSTTEGIVIAGGNTAANSASIARLTATGTLDSTFGTNGIESVSYGSGLSYITSIALAADGSFYASVFGLDNTGASVLFLAHYLATGTLDTTWANGVGAAVEYFANNGGTGNDLAQAVAIDPVTGFVFQGGTIPDPVDLYQDWAVLEYWP